jgi:Phage Mu protein F like protein
LDPTLDAQFSLVCLAIKKARGSLTPRAVLSCVQDEWGLPSHLPIQKADDTMDTGPGAHGIPEIGRQERAFYDALTDGQKDAYRAVRILVDQLYESQKGWDGIDPWSIDTPIDDWKKDAFNRLATHPMQAYMVGQMLAADALAAPMQRPLMPTDSRAIKFLEHYTFNEIDQSFERLKGNLRGALIEGMEAGRNPKEVGRLIANELKDYETWWDVIAITETSRAESQGRLREVLDAGVKRVIGSSAHDSRVCDDCLRLIDGKIYPAKSIVGESNYGRKRADWIACIPLHPRCRCVWLPYDEED